MARFRCISHHRKALFHDPAHAKRAAVRIRISDSNLSTLLQWRQLSVPRKGRVHLNRDIETRLVDATGRSMFDVLLAMKPYPQLKMPDHLS